MNSSGELVESQEAGPAGEAAISIACLKQGIRSC